jgi:formylglycine-generating enzyme required for sulfatase activity
MRRRDAGREDRKARPLRWRVRLSNWFRRAESGDSEAPREACMAVDVDPPSIPLEEEEIEALIKSYLYRLRERFGTLYLYGLDERRRAVQEGGQTLDPLALYQPLSTTAQVPIEEDKESAETNALSSSVHKTRPLTVLEAVGRERKAILRGHHGAGKSTFLRYLALSLAEQSQEGEHTGLVRLGPAWTHGWLFPLWVDLRDFCHSGYEDTAAGLCAYIAADLDIYPDQLCKQLIAPGGILFLLDGLEMAPEATAGLIGSLDALSSAVSAGAPNHVLVASQMYVDLDHMAGDPFAGFAEIVLSPWDLERMDGYVRAWYAELSHREWIDDQAARDLPGQLCSALRRDNVQKLAQRPSLMAMIALLHTLHGRLATDVGMFYHDLIDLTLAIWSEGRAESERDLRQVFDLEGLRTVVSQVTYHAFARLGDAGELVEFAESDLRAVLIDVCRDGRRESVSDLVTRMLARPCLLDERSAGVYTFVDAGVQAYVVARHLATQPDLPQRVVQLAQESFYQWRQVILFALSQEAWLGDDPGTALAAIRALVEPSMSEGIEQEPEAVAWRLAWLAGEAIVRLGQSFEAESSQLVQTVKDRLVIVLEQGLLKPHERAQAGRALDRFPGGDSRLGISMPASIWCQVAGGPFWLGEGDDARRVDVGAFWIAHYPVTNAQYVAFVADTGRVPPSHWHGGVPPVGLGNHPVVNVTWQDAHAFCAWWNERLDDMQFWVYRPGRPDALHQVPYAWRVRLPTSAEWEKATRGGILIPAAGGDRLKDNPLPHRLYPWGNSWRLSTVEARGDEARCNVSESNIGATTPVGMYPDGASPYGVMDVAGNVWEWCLDWADDQQRYKVRRGGAFRYAHDQARCSAYDRAYPGLAWPYVGFRPVLGPPLEEPVSDGRWPIVPDLSSPSRGEK